jgi:hypothetical protein
MYTILKFLPFLALVALMSIELAVDAAPPPGALKFATCVYMSVLPRLYCLRQQGGNRQAELL